MLFFVKKIREGLLPPEAGIEPSIARLLDAGDNADEFVPGRVYAQTIHEADGVHDYHVMKIHGQLCLKKSSALTGGSVECFVMREMPSGAVTPCRMKRDESPAFQTALIAATVKTARLRK